MSGDDLVQNDKSNEKMIENELTASTKDEGFWREMWHQVRLVWYLIRDPEVPLYLKLLPMAALIYILIPTDFIPDVFPVVGQLDDLTALIVGGKVFIELAPQRVVAQYIQSMRRNLEVIQSEDSQVVGDVGRGDGDIPELIIEGEFEEIEEEDQAS